MIRPFVDLLSKVVFYNIQQCFFSGPPLCTARIMKSEAILDLIDRREHIETAARALKAISHPLRLKILCVVGDEEVCVQDIVDAVGTSQSNISQHLAILRDKGVLNTRKDANRVYYRVADPRTLQLIVLMREVFCGVPAARKRKED
jgi:DNA-binding transcriptional ArsR family regulator